MLAVLALLPSCRRTEAPQQIPSRLALGAQARNSGEIEVGFFSPAALNGLEVQQILDLRKASAAGSRELIAGEYSPLAELFSQVDTSKPWRSLFGVLSGNLAQLCGEGPALESFPILNPLMLASNRFWALSQVSQRFSWDESKSDYERRKKPDFPLLLKPQSLQYHPAQSRAMLTYNASMHLPRISAWTTNQMTIEDLGFNVSTYNARDFGFRYVTIDTSATFGIKSEGGLSADPAEILDSPRLLEFKKDGLWCNSTTWAMPTLRGLKPSTLPAELHLDFWYETPTQGRAADLRYIIRII